MSKEEPLASQTSNLILAGVGLAISFPLVWLAAKILVAAAQYLLGNKIPSLSALVVAALAISVLIAFPLHMLALTSKIRVIHHCSEGLLINGQLVPWHEIKKITIFYGNSLRFIITYSGERKQNKVVGSLVTVKRAAVLAALHSIAREHKIPISKWWL